MMSLPQLLTPAEVEIAMRLSVVDNFQKSTLRYPMDPNHPPFAEYINMRPSIPMRLPRLVDSVGDIDKVLETYVSCIGNKFYREEELFDEPHFFLGQLRTIKFVKYFTKSRKGDETLCSLIILEEVPRFAVEEPAAPPVQVGHQWFVWANLFMALEPFGVDNFTYFLGPDPHAARAVVPSGSPPTLNLVLTPTPAHPCVEYRVFFKCKYTSHVLELETKPDHEFIYNASCKSRFMDGVGLRAILGKLAASIETPESMASKTDCGGGEVPSALMKEFKAAELEQLRFIVKDQCTPKHFFTLYMAWLYGLKDLPINLHPVEYQTYGRRFLMCTSELANWDECVFCLLLGARAKALSESPVEASLFFGLSADVHIEVSPYDNRFACKTRNGDKLCDLVKDDIKIDWIFDTLEDTVLKQDAFFKNLAVYSDNPDTVVEAYCLLTEGMVTPMNEQNLLGLSEGLLLRLARREINFHPDLMSMIKSTMANYCDWVLPLPDIEFDARLRPATDVLFKIGEFRMPEATA